MGKKIISVTLDESIKNEIMQRANFENRSFSNMLEHIIKDYLIRARKRDELVSEYEAKGYFEEAAESEQEASTTLIPSSDMRFQEKTNRLVSEQKQADLDSEQTEIVKEDPNITQQPVEPEQQKTLLEQIKQDKGGINLNNMTHKF